MTAAAPSDLSVARTHLENCEWDAALKTASALGPLDGVAEADRQALIGCAHWWLGCMDECIDAREQAYAIYADHDDHLQAGMTAVWLWQDNQLKGRPSIAGGWLRRAKRILADHPESGEYACMLLREAETAHGAGDLDTARAIAGDALTLARRLKSADVEAQALQTVGRILIDAGEVSNGMSYLDDAMLLAIEGRVPPFATGKVFCSLISACEELGDVRRAAEWTDATARWSEKHPMAMWPGVCRVHHASLLLMRGESAAAEREAQRACDDLNGFHVGVTASGYAEIGEIRRRLGDLDGAEEAFARAEELTGDQSAGLALVRLAQRRIDAALAIITPKLDASNWNRLSRGKLLPILVQVTVAAGDLDRAEVAAAELEVTAADYASPLLTAYALTSRGRLQLARGAAEGACATLRQALTHWQDLDVPYEVATVRLLLGQACRECGDEEAAVRSLQAAAAIFDRLGAALDGRQARDLTGGPGPLPAGLTEREAEVVRLVAAGKTNKDIAAELFLSERTVARHLSNIFTKIDVTTRTAAAAWSFEHNL